MDTIIIMDLLCGILVRYCVMFISKNYANKIWTSHERRSALAKAIEEKEEYNRGVDVSAHGCLSFGLGVTCTHGVIRNGCLPPPDGMGMNMQNYGVRINRIVCPPSTGPSAPDGFVFDFRCPRGIP